nr:hypothetical protein [Kofleriaceae bacterium]
MTWRDGVHVTGTPIWCDARRRRDVCFASSGDLAGGQHGQLIGTQDTLFLLGADPRDGHLAVPLRQPFTLGALRLELIPSGRGVGAAALHVDLGGSSVLYAGDIRMTPGGYGDLAEARPADAVVVRATDAVASPLPAIADTAARLVAWLRDHLAAGRRPSVRCDSIVDAFEIGLALARADLPLVGAAPLQRLAQIGGPAIGRAGRAAAVALQVAPANRPAGPTAIVAQRASEHDHAGFDAGFCWQTRATRPELLAWIESTSARQIFVTGRPDDAAELAATLGPRARPLTPPLQQQLFRSSS